MYEYKGHAKRGGPDDKACAGQLHCDSIPLVMRTIAMWCCFLWSLTWYAALDNAIERLALKGLAFSFSHSC